MTVLLQVVGGLEHADSRSCTEVLHKGGGLGMTRLRLVVVL